MSVWKKASKVNQRTHRERHQPEERAHLGLLEKKKDYQKRARDFNDKKKTLRLLKQRALDRNPDEFYHHMINSKVDNGRHFEKETEDEDTPDQLKLMRTQDLKYITLKRTQELKKIERLQNQLHLASSKRINKHVIFPKNAEENTQNNKQRRLEQLSNMDIPDFDMNKLSEAVKNKKGIYKHLAKRIERERELAIVQQKLEVNRAIESKSTVLKPKRIVKGTKDSAPVYQWKYERKK